MKDPKPYAHYVCLALKLRFYCGGFKAFFFNYFHEMRDSAQFERATVPQGPQNREIKS